MRALDRAKENKGLALSYAIVTALAVTGVLRSYLH